MLHDVDSTEFADFEFAGVSFTKLLYGNINSDVHQSVNDTNAQPQPEPYIVTLPGSSDMHQHEQQIQSKQLSLSEKEVNVNHCEQEIHSEQGPISHKLDLSTPYTQD